MLELVFAALLPLLPSDQASAVAETPSRPGSLLPARSFSQLFTVPEGPAAVDGKKTVALGPPQPRVKRKVVCGMTLIIVDGSRVDPKMAIGIGGGKDVDPGMPRVPKPMCGEQEKR
jgi:hypothetical protein